MRLRREGHTRVKSEGKIAVSVFKVQHDVRPEADCGICPLRTIDK